MAIFISALGALVVSLILRRHFEEMAGRRK